METVYFRCADIAKMTGNESATVRKWCREGKLKAIKPAGTRDYLIKREDFESFMGSGNKKQGSA